MKYLLRFAIAALAVALAVTPVTAQQQEDAAVIKGELSGRSPRNDTTVTQQGPFTVVSTPISDETLPMIRAMMGIGLEDEVAFGKAALSINKVYPLAVGASIIKPPFANGLVVNDISPLAFVGYYYYWISANFSDDTLTKTTTFILSGPGKGFRLKGQLEYQPRTVSLFFVRSDPAELAGHLQTTGAGQRQAEDCLVSLSRLRHLIAAEEASEPQLIRKPDHRSEPTSVRNPSHSSEPKRTRNPAIASEPAYTRNP